MSSIRSNTHSVSMTSVPIFPTSEKAPSGPTCQRTAFVGFQVSLYFGQGPAGTSDVTELLKFTKASLFDEVNSMPPFNVADLCCAPVSKRALFVMFKVCDSS